MKLKLTKKKLGIFIIAIAAGAAVYYFTQNKPSASSGANVTTTDIVKGDIKDTISFKAPLEGMESAEVVSSLHYEVLDIYVKEGDQVKKGDLLAVLDTESLQKDISVLQDNLELLKLQQNEDIDNKQKEYDAAVDALNNAQKEYDKIKALYDVGGTSKDNLDQVQNTLDDAKRNVEKFNVQDGKVIKGDVENKNIEIASKNIATKRDDLTDCRITSPIDGTITRVNIKKGRFANETDDDKPMFVIENLSKLSMTVYVSEYDIAKIKIGQEAEITADFLQGEVVKGVVSRISPTGEAKSGTNERVIPIEIEITEPSDKLIAGINVNAEITINSSEGQLIVPIEAVYEDPQGIKKLYLVTDGKIHIVSVETGLEDDLNIAVKSDELKEGDKVILMPTPDLTEGMTVNVPISEGETQK